VKTKCQKCLKNKKEIVNDENLLKFLISNISIFFEEKKTIVLQNFFDKISDPYNKTTQKF